MDPNERTIRFLRYLEAMYPCSFCGEFLDGTDVFCTRCGTKDPRFDSRKFKGEHGESVGTRIKRECQKGHPGLRGWFLECPEARSEEPFCDVCGARVEA